MGCAWPQQRQVLVPQAPGPSWRATPCETPLFLLRETPFCLQVQPWEKGVRAGVAAAAVLASQAAGPAWQTAGAAACGVTLGVSGRRRGRLSASGATSACQLHCLIAFLALLTMFCWHTEPGLLLQACLLLPALIATSSSSLCCLAPHQS